MEKQLEEITKEVNNLSKGDIVRKETFRVRPLSLQESPFRGCLGRDCSTRNYFKTAMDPSYIYWTLTDKDFLSHGYIAVILGQSKNKTGRTVKTAFIDHIQNIPLTRILPTLEAIHQSLKETGYTLALPEDTSQLSNDYFIKQFVSAEILPGLKSLKFFKSNKTKFLVLGQYSDKKLKALRLREFKLNQAPLSFEIYPLEIQNPKKIEKGFSLKDWFLSKMESNSEKDQLMFISNLLSLVQSHALTFDQALNYLLSKIEDKSLSFELRKKALFSLIQLPLEENIEKWRVLAKKPALEYWTTTEIQNNEHIELTQKPAFIQFGVLDALLMKFSEKEQTIIIAEIQTWEHSSITNPRQEYLIALSTVINIPRLLPFISQSRRLHILLPSAKHSLNSTILEHPTVSIEAIKALVKMGANVNGSSDALSPLSIALSQKRIDIANYFLDQGADVNSRFSGLDDDITTAMMIMAKKRALNEVLFLLERGADPNITNKHGLSVWSYFFGEEQAPLIRDWAFDKMESKSEKDQLLLMPNLPAFVQFKWLDKNKTLDYLLSKIQDKGLSFELRKQALFVVIQLRMLKSYIPVPTNEVISTSTSAWDFSVYRSNTTNPIEELKFLSNKLSNFSTKEQSLLLSQIRDWKKTKIAYQKVYITSLLNSLVDVKYLPAILESEWIWRTALKLGFHINRKDSMSHRTLLSEVAYKGDVKLAQTLLEMGADPNTGSSEYSTLLIALTHIDNDSFEFFPPSRKAIDYQLLPGIQIATLLLDKGADINFQNTLGQTTLMQLAIYGRLEAVKFLLSKGADPNIKDNQGQTLKDYLKKYEKQLLLERQRPFAWIQYRRKRWSLRSFF